MTALQIAQLAIALAPIAERIVVEGGKLIAEYRKDLTAEEMAKALELSKSVSWEKFDFGNNG